MTRLIPSFLILTILFTGCASPYYVIVPDNNSSETGTLEIELASRGQVTVLIDDQKVETPQRWVSSVVIDDIEIGEREVKVSVIRRGKSSLEEVEDTIQIRPDQKSTMIVNNPANEAGFWALTFVTSVAAIVLANSISGQ